MRDFFKDQGPLIVLLVCLVAVAALVITGNVLTSQKTGKCRAAGFAIYDAGYCITRVGGTDIVMPIAEVAE